MHILSKKDQCISRFRKFSSSLYGLGKSPNSNFSTLILRDFLRLGSGLDWVGLGILFQTCQLELYKSNK